MRKFNITLSRQAKQKQALLESNLSGTLLMNDKNIISMGNHSDSPLIFLEFHYALKNSHK
jgi:hypothetical protein